MKGAVITKVAMGEVDKQFGYRRYIVYYTSDYLAFDPEKQMLALQKHMLRVDAVDEMDAAIKGMAKLRSLYGANNVRFGSEDELCHDTVKGGEDEFGDGSTD
jgi:molybdate-binding protein